MGPGEDIRVEVIWSPCQGDVRRVALCLPSGSTVGEALTASRLLVDRHEASGTLSLGVWGKAAPADLLLRDGDRVEVYRALTVDPKEARRLRYDPRRQARKPPTGR